MSSVEPVTATIVLMTSSRFAGSRMNRNDDAMARTKRTRTSLLAAAHERFTASSWNWNADTASVDSPSRR